MAFRDDLLKLALGNQQNNQMAVNQKVQGGGIPALLAIAAQVGQGANPNAKYGQTIQGLSNTYINQLGNQRQSQFSNEISQIHQAQIPVDQKMQLLASTISKYGHDPKQFKDVFDMYGNVLTAQSQNQQVPVVNGFDPQTGQPIVGGYVPKGAKFVPQGSNPNSPQNKRGELNSSTKIRSEFIKLPEVKDYMTVATNVRSMDSLLAKSMTGDVQNKVALDQALITLYNKLTDPSSVVRESEYSRTPENLPLVNQIQGAIQKVNKGGAGLTDADRQALVIGAKIIANERGRTFNDRITEYTDLANEYGIDPKLVTRNMPLHQDFDIKNSLGGANVMTATNPKNGAKIKSLDGGKIWQKA